MADLNQIVFKESNYGCYNELMDVVQNWAAANGVAAKLKRGEYGHIQEIVDGELKNSRTITVYGEGTMTAPVNPKDCEHGNTEITATTETCIREGSIIEICKSCFKTIHREIIPAAGHTPQRTVTKEPTTEETGLAETKCTVCGDILRVEVLPKLKEAIEKE